ncbi:MAG TPA: hypothetical protein VFC33_11460 [Acidimicrobiia bacterium]|nr:hypothetical protein [Acidimicrobiia bacterium]
MTSPADVDDALRGELVDELTLDGLVEVTLTVALASAFSRAAIAWGPPPGMPVLEVPTPEP